MRPQRTDDPARNLHNIFRAIPGFKKWWFQARFSAWGVATALTLAWLWAYTLVIPFHLLVAAAAWAASGAYTRTQDGGKLTRLVAFAVPTTMVLLIELLVAPHRILGLQTMPGLALPLLIVPASTPPVPIPALLAAILTAVLITRRFMPHVNGNTPVRWWRNIPQLIAAGPRPRRQPATIGHTAPRIDTGLDDLTDLQYAALAAEETPRMALYEMVTVPIDAERWLGQADPRPGEKPASEVLAWLQGNGIRATVDDAGWLILPHGRVRPGDYVFFTTGTTPADTVDHRPAAVFTEQFRPVVTAA